MIIYHSDNEQFYRCGIILCFLTAALCAIYAGVLSSRTFSPAEGWYSYYAYLINEEGAVPYLDFELLFPPLYTYVIAFITKIFGYAIIILIKKRANELQYVSREDFKSKELLSFP